MTNSYIFNVQEAVENAANKVGQFVDTCAMDKLRNSNAHYKENSVPLVELRVQLRDLQTLVSEALQATEDCVKNVK